MNKNVVIVGYGGHSYVAIDCIHSAGLKVVGYCDLKESNRNIYNLEYFGAEADLPSSIINEYAFFLAIGDNKIRAKAFERLNVHSAFFISAIHQSTVLSNSAIFGKSVMLAPGAIVNPLVVLNDGVIVNTNASIDHECNVGSFSHIGPGATLCGNVKVGNQTLIGAGAVIKEGVEIGSNCIIGAGAVVLRNVPDSAVIVGNPAKQIK